MSVASVTSPAASGDTRISTESVAEAPPAPVPLTSIRWVPPDAVAGTVTFRVTFVSVSPPGDSTPSMVKPPPCKTAVQPSGTAPTARPTRPGVAVLTVISKLGVAPGATAIAGYGVVSVIASTAPIGLATASDASPSVHTTRASLARRDGTVRGVDTKSPPRCQDDGGSTGFAARGRACRMPG